MSGTQNKKTVETFISCMSQGDVEGFINLYHDDGGVWTSGETLISGDTSKAEIKAFAGQIYETFPDGLKFTITGMTAEGDRVAVEAFSEGRHVSGQMYRNQYHFLFLFKDGKIFKLKEYMDTEKVTDILCGGQRPPQTA
ncbi:MAG: nuclear transport factor 2 family protein [Parvibaculales bacterium]